MLDTFEFAYVLMRGHFFLEEHKVFMNRDHILLHFHEKKFYPETYQISKCMFRLVLSGISIVTAAATAANIYWALAMCQELS